MLVQFSVENFRAIAERQTFSMEPGKGASHTHPTGSSRHPNLMKAAALYGANGSGKSSFVLALSFLQHLVTESGSFSSDESIPFQPHRLGKEWLQSPTRMEIIFSIANQIWRYGFAVNGQRIIEEWLYCRPNKTSRESYFFIRDSSGNTPSISRKLSSYRELLIEKTNANQLFLSKLDQFSSKATHPAYAWIAFGLRPISSVTEFPRAITADFCKDPQNKDAVSSLLRAMDIALDTIEIATHEHNQTSMFEALRGIEDPVVRYDKDKFTRYDVGFTIRTRENETAAIKFDDLSLGTRNLFALAGPLLLTLNLGLVLVIDELNQSFHPEILSLILDLFYSGDSNKEDAQIIFTSHDVTVMDLLERDQIWMTELNENYATEIFGLADFGTTREGGARRKAAFGKRYLENRFGALPSTRFVDAVRAVKASRSSWKNDNAPTS